MWYTVAKFEAGKIKAGTVFVCRREDDSVVLNKVNLGDALHFMDSFTSYRMDPDDCREWLTKPTKDLDSAIEESFLICEAQYC
jgi:hypothetical protein